jgi:geranylgeranyl pyrophosphate synthase
VQAAIEVIGQGTTIQQAKALSSNYADLAFRSIKKIPPSLFRNGLKTLVQLIIERDF